MSVCHIYVENYHGFSCTALLGLDKVIDALFSLTLCICSFDGGTSLQVLNLTDLELNRVDIRVGLSGALHFMDGSPQAVRQLRNLVSQVVFHTLNLFFLFLLAELDGRRSAPQMILSFHAIYLCFI